MGSEWRFLGETGLPPLQGDVTTERKARSAKCGAWMTPWSEAVRGGGNVRARSRLRYAQRLCQDTMLRPGRARSEVNSGWQGMGDFRAVGRMRHHPSSCLRVFRGAIGREEVAAPEDRRAPGGWRAVSYTRRSGSPWMRASQDEHGRSREFIQQREGAGALDSVTEPKRSPRAKRPPSLSSPPGATALLEMP